MNTENVSKEQKGNELNPVLAPFLLFVCFIIGHKIVNRKCVRCGTKFGVPKMENCPPPPNNIIISSLSEGEEGFPS
jgi:hypothetical protein